MLNEGDIMIKSYIKGIIPAVIASIVFGTFSIVDGLFIGHKLGDVGLAAINYAYPITAFIQSIGFAIGMGGSIFISINIGCANKDEERKYLFLTYILFIIASALLMSIFMCTYKPLLHAFGAYGEAYDMACSYIFVILLGTFAQILGQGLLPILRNYNYNAYTMISMSAGFVLNIILDYTLIYKAGLELKGAAIGTFAAQVLTSLMLILVLCRKKYLPKICFSFKKIGRILLSGLSSFAIFFSPSFILIVMNKASGDYGGDKAVAAYTAASYITFIVVRLFQGVCDGSQPKLSLFYGSGDKKKMNSIFKYSVILILLSSCLITLFIIFSRVLLSGMFGLSSEAIEIFKRCLLILSIPFISLAIMKIIMCYFGAINKDIYALILSFAEPVFTLILIFIFPRFFSLDGVWYASMTAELASGVLAICIILIDYHHKQIKLDKHKIM